MKTDGRAVLTLQGSKNAIMIHDSELSGNVQLVR